MRVRAFILAFVAASALAVAASGSSLPPKPADYVADGAGILDTAQRSALAQKLAQFERDTSNQFLVATFGEVPDGMVMEDFTQRTAEAWGAGRKQQDNGLVLFVFPNSRKLRIEVGYGLEGAVPDALANRIINDDIVPSFRAGDMAAGIERGAAALMAAAKGEYRGTGQTVAEESADQGEDSWAGLVFLVIFLVIVFIAWKRGHGLGGTSYGSGGRRDTFFPSGGGFSSGGGFGGGGFSGGGGSFGGGGASGRW